MPTITHNAKRTVITFAAVFTLLVLASASEAQQYVYYSYSPVIAAPAVTQAPTYVSNYVPTGNYANVTAYSPPVVAAMPTSSVAVTNYYAPSPVVTTAAYAPAVVTPVTAYYAPAAYYAPTAYTVPVYRRGLFGRYRPAGAAFVPAY